MRCWLAVDPLGCKRSVIDSIFKPRKLQVLVGTFRPLRSDLIHEAPVVPLPDLQPEALRPDLPHSQHHVSVGVLLLALGAVMDRDVGDHPSIDKLLLYKRVNESLLLFLAEAGGEGDIQFPRELRVHPLFGCLHLVPQPLALAYPVRGAVGGKDVAFPHVLLPRVVVLFVVVLVSKAFSRSVGGARHGRTAALARYDLRMQMIDRHSSSYLLFATARPPPSLPWLQGAGAEPRRTHRASDV